MGTLQRLRFASRVASTNFSIGLGDIDPSLFGLSRYEDLPLAAGRVTRAQAMSVPAVKRARDIICATPATLPLVRLNSKNEVIPSSLLEQPEIDRPRVITVTETLEDMLFEKVAWWRVEVPDYNGFPVKVKKLRIDQVQEQDGKVYVDGKYVPDGQLIRFDSPNDPLLVAGARAIRTAIRLEAAALKYAEEPQAQGWFESADGHWPFEDEDEADTAVKSFLKRWKKARQENTTAAVPPSLKYVQANLIPPKDLQLAEGRDYAVLEIARLTGLDPQDLGVGVQSNTYNNGVDRRRGLVDFTLSHYLSAFEQRLSMGDVTPRGHRVRVDYQGFVRANEAERMTTYKTGLEIGAYDIKEVQRREELPPYEKPKAPVPTAPQDPTDPQEGKEQSVQQSVKASLSFSDTHQSMTFTFEPDSEFAASAEKRTVSGTLIPFGPVGRNGQGRWRFQAGSIEWNKSAVSRVKLNREHERTSLLGAATVIRESDSGVTASFKVARGPVGDQALTEAEDNVLDGLSAEVDILDYTTDSVDPSVFLVTKARLTGAALTGSPAFDDARITSVAASANTKERFTMECTICGKVHAAGTPCATAPAPTDFSAIAQAITDGFANLAQGGREVIPAARGGERLRVNEPVPYRFSGVRGQYDFSTDLIRSLKLNDSEAKTRLDQFMNATFAVAQADVNELNPTRNRPDLYVDNLDFSTPVWDAINKGTLTDSTPFTLPKFNTASGLVGDHTEGQAPAAGAFTTAGQTITPTSTSGRAEITRETWDQGGNPQLSTILWRQITRDYYEALEVGAVAMLDALTPTAIALNGTDADLDADVTANLALLAYIRGGNRFRDFFVASNLFTALASAVDDTGRKLFPVIAPSNASGTTDGFFGEVAVGGLRAKPAWALEAGNGGDGSSYLFDREVVHGWATAPRQFTFEYRVEMVDIAVWGYKAFANTRLAGVREVTYSAV